MFASRYFASHYYAPRFYATGDAPVEPGFIAAEDFSFAPTLSEGVAAGAVAPALITGVAAVSSPTIAEGVGPGTVAIARLAPTVAVYAPIVQDSADAGGGDPVEGTTVEEIIEQALARAMEFGDRFPTTRAVLYRRVGIRQQYLYSKAAEVNPEFFGDTVTGALVGGVLPLANLVDSVDTLGAVTRVEIADAGTSGYATGDECHIVSAHDPGVAFPPRVTLRKYVVRQVASDLAGVESLTVFYAYRPAALGPHDAETAIEFPEAFQELLVIDLARELAKKALGLEQSVRQAHIALLTAEEAELMAAFLEHVASFTTLESRFGASPYHPRSA